MLAQFLAVIVGLGSFVLFTDAFLFPEVHRKSDFTWSGVGFFYALVLWVCAGRFSGAVLLGQAASVAFIGWLEWQMITLRWQGIAPDYRAKASSLGAILVKAAYQVQRIGNAVVEKEPPASSPTRGGDRITPVAQPPEPATDQAMPDQPTVDATEAEEPPTPEQAPTEALSTESLDLSDQVSNESTTASTATVVTEEPAMVDRPEDAPDSSPESTADPAEPSQNPTYPPAVEVPAAEEPAPATKASPSPATTSSPGFLAGINNTVQQVLISLGLKKRKRPTIVLDRTPKPDDSTEPAPIDDSAPPISEDITTSSAEPDAAESSPVDAEPVDADPVDSGHAEQHSDLPDDRPPSPESVADGPHSDTDDQGFEPLTSSSADSSPTDPNQPATAELPETSELSADPPDAPDTVDQSLEPTDPSSDSPTSDSADDPSENISTEILEPDASESDLPEAST